jgi:anti-sigma factor RsiW
MTEPDTHLPPEVEADLVALADGHLRPSRRVEVEARVAADPVLAAALERQRRALAMLSALDTPAPLELRLRVEELKSRRRRFRRARWIPAAFLATASATAALLLLLLGSGPAIEDVFAVALRPATAPVAGGEEIDGLRFPQPQGWNAVGSRRDVVAGRDTMTIVYKKGTRQIAYTIVASPALNKHDRVLSSGGRRAYVWARADHTCVISGNVDLALLRKAAHWR